MSKLHLVTGYKGEEHIQSADQGSFNASFFGGGEFVMEAGNQFEASIMDNNTVRILDGDALMKGRHLRIEPNTYVDVTIQTGTAGVNRNDLIVFQYSEDNNTGIEASDIVVIKGTETEGTATDPTYTDGDILGGAEFNQMPMYRVKVEGVVLTGIEPLFTVIPTYKTLAEMYARQFQEACNTYIGLLNILDTMEEVEANTQEGQLAGALALKELKNTLQKNINTVNTSLNSEVLTLETEIAKKVTNSFTANTVPYANASGKLASSVVTTTELLALQGVSSKIQNQLDAKLPKAGGELTGNTTTRSLWAATADTWNIGSSAAPYKQVLANQFRAYLNSIQYLQLTAQIEGTEDTEGVGALWLGNNTAKGNAGNARGQIVMYNGGTVYAVVRPNENMTANSTMILASKGGTIPTVSLSGTTLTVNI